ncbi:MAG: cation:proton antiporter [Dehalococcoidia bacterium]
MSHTDVVLYLLFDLAIIIALARVMGAAARRLGQPAVIGEILAGIIFGPTVLGRLNESWPTDLFPPEVPLGPIAQLGLVFFMFLVGLELDPKLLRSQGRRALQISLSGVIVPLALGIAVGFALFTTNSGGDFLPETERANRLTFAVFIGAAMCITAFPVLARILVETGLYRTAVGTATLCAGAVDDVIAWILLAGVVGVVESGSPVEAVYAFLLTGVFILVMFLAVRPLLELMARRYDATGHLTIDQVATVLAGLLLAAWATELIGIHAIFGAFVFGAIMPKRSALTKELTDKLEDFTVIVLLPVFFAVTGLRTNLLTLDSLSLLGWLGLILAAAVVGKFAGCGIAARLTGSSTRDSVVVGALMNTRGLTELVILTIGLNLGVLSDRTFAMMVIMALATTVMAAPIVNRLMPAARRVATLGKSDEAAPGLIAARVVVAIDDFEHAPKLVETAIALTGDRRPAELILVRLIPPPRGEEFRTGLLEESIEMADSFEALRALAARVGGAGISVRTLTFLSSDVARDLANLAREQGADTLVAGWHGAALPARTAASPAAPVLALAPCDVAILVDRGRERLSAVPGAGLLAGLPGGSHDAATLRFAAAYARRAAAPLRLTGYLAGTPQGDHERASKALALAADALASSSGQTVSLDFEPGRALESLVEGSAAAAIAIVGVADDATPAEPFGREVGAFVQRSACDVIVVRAADGAGAPSRTAPAGQEDWPFLAPAGEAPPTGPVPAAAGPSLQRLDGWGRPVVAVEVGEALTIGRSPGNRLALVDDALVSRAHAVVEPRGGSFYLRDLGSTNGTRIWRDGDWRVVDDEAMNNGDLLVIGANVFRFVASPALEAA